MKKLLFLFSSILILSSTVSAKEIVRQPESSKEVAAMPSKEVEVVAETIVVEEPPIIYPETYLTLRVGGDVAPRYKQAHVEDYTLNDKDGKNFGGEVALEFMRELWPESGFQLGLGVAYQRHSDVDGKSYTDPFPLEIDVPRFDSVPIYATAKYVFGNWNGWKPYAKADLGYSFNFKHGGLDVNDEGERYSLDTKIKDGMYWGAGLGVEYGDWTLDAMYKANDAKLKVSGDEGSKSSDYNYSRVTFSVGYKFDMNNWW